MGYHAVIQCYTNVNQYNIDCFACLFTVFMLMMENCFRNIKKIRENVYDIIISSIYYKIEAEKQPQSIY